MNYLTDLTCLSTGLVHKTKKNFRFQGALHMYIMDYCIVCTTVLPQVACGNLSSRSPECDMGRKSIPSTLLDFKLFIALHIRSSSFSLSFSHHAALLCYSHLVRNGICFRKFRIPLFISAKLHQLYNHVFTRGTITAGPSTGPLELIFNFPIYHPLILKQWFLLWSFTPLTSTLQTFHIHEFTSLSRVFHAPNLPNKFRFQLWFLCSDSTSHQSHTLAPHDDG